MMKRLSRSRALVIPLGARPVSRARVRGDPAHAELRGVVNFYAERAGTLVLAELWGLPFDPAPCAANICAIHIHEGGSCGGGGAPFSGALGHYNPGGCAHPAHAGDMPPLFSSRGYAFSAFYTERFRAADVVGRTVIVHERRDDFTSQPAGDAGGRIGCGEIERVR